VTSQAGTGNCRTIGKRFIEKTAVICMRCVFGQPFAGITAERFIWLAGARQAADNSDQQAGNCEQRPDAGQRLHY
jgi:hypothetical protein